jgi:hypothetical protein
MRRILRNGKKYAALIVLAYCSIFQAGAAVAELAVHPAVTLSEEYNDNLLLQNSDRKEDFITRAIPSIGLRFTSPRWIWDASYALECNHYERNGEYNGVNHTTSINSMLEIVRTSFFLDAHEEFKRVSKDINQDFTQQSPLVNQVEQNTVTIHPFATLRFSEAQAVSFGHIMTDTRYRSGEGVNRTEHVDYGEVGTLLSSRMTFTLGAKNTYDRNDDDEFDTAEGYAGLEWRYAGGSSAHARIGRESTKYASHGTVNQTTWNGGVNRASAVTNVSLETELKHVQDSNDVSLLSESAVFSVMRMMARSTLVLSGARTEIFDAATGATRSVTHAFLGNYRYVQSQRTTCIFGVNMQDIGDKTIQTRTYTGQASLRVEHRRSERIAGAVEYRFLNSASPDVPVNNYRNQRVFLELTMSF